MSHVIYIAGYGRSGSTVISAVLGTHPELVSVGEIGFALEDWSDPNRRCSCGRAYSECPFWAGLAPAELATPGNRRVVRTIESFAAIPTLWWRSRTNTATRYREIQQRVLDYAAAAGGGTRTVDSSKSARLTAGRPLALSLFGGQDVRVIHLVRDGRATLRSLVHTGSNWALEGREPSARWPALRAGVGWVLANLNAELLRFTLGGERYIRLRFEDFLCDPPQWLERVGRFLGLDMDPVIKGLTEPDGIPAGHMVGGNRVRYEPSIRLRAAGASDSNGALNRRERMLFGLVGGWLNRRYEYDG